MIRIKNLKFGYSRKNPVLDGIDLSLGAGAITGLLGKNGVGKTTLLKLIAGALRPDGGEVSVLGHSPEKRSVDFLSQIYLLPEEMPEMHLTIDKYMKINAPFYPRFSEDEFRSFLAELEIADTAVSMSKLSLGNRKKVFIAFALATNARLILMDEPTNGLDIPSKTVLRKLLRIKADDDRLILISTHQVRDLQNILDTVVILDNTKVLLNVDTDAITRQLFFGISDGGENPDDVLYSAPSVAGTQIVRVNGKDEESDVDVELLFNAAFNAKQKIKELFNK
ncbi:MAG: ATP-binding cassette domain-containing protein [Bacteroidales bacterium]|nr:ATP-binding cassette domain-containing protein [Bacteroidales bacterium]